MLTNLDKSKYGIKIIPYVAKGNLKSFYASSSFLQLLSLNEFWLKSKLEAAILERMLQNLINEAIKAKILIYDFNCDVLCASLKDFVSGKDKLSEKTKINLNLICRLYFPLSLKYGTSICVAILHKGMEIWDPRGLLAIGMPVIINFYKEEIRLLKNLSKNMEDCD